MKRGRSEGVRVRAVAVAALLVSLAAAAGCKEAGRSLVQANVSADPSVAGLETVDLVVKQSGSELGRQSYAWMGSTLEIGIFLSSSVSGDVQVYAVGLAASTPIAQSESQTVRIAAGQDSAEVSLRLLPLRDLPDGGGDGGGNDGGGNDGAPPPDGGADAADAPVVRTWGPTAPVETNTDEDDLHPAVAVDSSGKATVAWEHGSAIWANRVDTRTGVRGAEAGIAGSLGTGPQVGVDGTGVATVIWDGPTDDAATQGLWSSTASGGGWTAPFRVSSGKALDAAIAVSANGVAIAAWTENNFIGGLNQFVVWASYRPAGGQWTAPRSLMSVLDANDRLPRVAMDGAGNGFVLWQQPPAPPTTDSTDSVWVARFTGAAFGTPEMIETYTAGDSISPNVAANASGSAAAVWLQSYADHDEIWGRPFVAGAWGTAAMIARASYIAIVDSPEVAVDPAGNALAAWAQSTASGDFNVRVARHGVGQAAWDAPLVVETNDLSIGDGSDEPSPRVGVDSAGNGVVVWRRLTSAGISNLYSVGVDARGTLGTVVRLDDNGTHGTFGHRLAVGPDGTAIAVWYYALEFNILSAIYR